MRKYTAQSSVRIIGGQWRGRRLPVFDLEGLRPTKDIVRETVFNWLQSVIEGSRCLDAFAGSGVLGFESASRGAAHVALLEKDAGAYAQLCANAKILQAQQVQILHVNAEEYLSQPGRAFDIVFLDPPFQSTLLPQVCEMLLRSCWIHPGTQVYIEFARADGFALPSAWEWHRQKQSGDVIYGLAQLKSK